MKAKSQIPNLLTLSNLICGVLSIYAIFHGQAVAAALLVLLAAVFDFFDGLVARALGVSGELGKQLDSLADVVSFGVAPVFMALHLVGTLTHLPEGIGPLIFGFLPVLMGAFAAYRLAVFNLDTRQSDRFIGMPTPAVALFWVSLLLISAQEFSADWLSEIYSAYLASPVALVISSLVFSLLMVAPLPLIALKFKDYRWKTNVWRYTLIAGAVVLLAIFAVKAVPIILLLYIALSAIDHLTSPKPHGI